MCAEQGASAGENRAVSDAAFALKECLGSLGEGEVSWGYGTSSVSVQGASLGVQRLRLLPVQGPAPTLGQRARSHVP